jgi:hypothetical protein
MIASSKELYEQRALVFLDILGFKRHIEDRRELDLLKALEIPKDIPTEMPGGLAEEVEISAFSDSIVISMPLRNHPNGEPRGGAWLLIYLAMYVQLKFLAYGMLVRGGATIGQLYHKGPVMFGPAMNEAYFIESQLAIYPRVVVSSDLRKRYQEELDTFFQRAKASGQSVDEVDVHDLQREAFWLSDDGVFFLNCLGANAPLPPEFTPDKSLIHKRPHPAAYGLDGGREFKFEVARRPLERPPKDERAIAKHEWFSNYVDRASKLQGQTPSP